MKALLFRSLLLLLLVWPELGLTRNANLSNWTKNLSGDEAADQVWTDTASEIAVSGPYVHVLWSSRSADWSTYRLRYKRSSNSGRTFEPTVTLFTTPWGESNHQLTDRLLAVDGNTVHILLSRSYPISATRSWYYELFYLRSTNAGESFEPRRKLFSGADAWHIRELRVSASQGRVTLGFNYYANWYNNFSIRLFNSIDRGATFSQSTAAASVDHSGGFQDLKRVGDKVFVLYYYQVQEFYYGHWQARIACAASLDGGRTFVRNWMTTPASNGEYLTYGLNDYHYAPNVAVAGDNVYVVWSQNDEAYNSTKTNVYLKRSTDSGRTFGRAEHISTNQPRGPLQVGQETVAAAGNYVYVVFLTTDSRVYLKRSLDGGASFLPVQELTEPNSWYYTTGGWWPMVMTDPFDSTGAKVHVLWKTPTYRYSEDGGKTFTEPVLLSPHFSWSGSGTNQAQMAIGRDNAVHWSAEGLYYSDGAFGDADIFYRAFKPAPSPTEFNQAMLFVSDRDAQRYDNMQVPSSDTLRFTSQITAEAWVKPNREAGVEGYFLFKSDPGSFGSFLIGQWREGQSTALLKTTTQQYDISGATLPNGQWSHVAMTYNANGGNDNFKLYVNGELSGKTTATGNIAIGDGILFVGGASSYRYYTSVRIDELRLWNRALTGAAIRGNMFKKLTGSEAGLQAYYNFDGTTKDITGHGNDGVLMYRESYVAGKP